MFLLDILDDRVQISQDGFVKSKWQFQENRFRVEIIKGARQRDSAFIPVAGGVPANHNFKLLTNPNKIFVQGTDSNVSDDALLLLSHDSSARSFLRLDEQFTTAQVMKTVTATNAAGNEIAVAAKLEKDQRLVLQQTGRYARWYVYSWDGGELTCTKFTDKEEFEFVVAPW